MVEPANTLRGRLQCLLWETMGTEKTGLLSNKAGATLMYRRMSNSLGYVPLVSFYVPKLHVLAARWQEHAVKTKPRPLVLIFGLRRGPVDVLTNQR